ncbi:phosphonate ABC transporter, permease protein PhnE [Treponema sp. HNW]|uniref:phosphonate ABC transporter, permease protein PhnE n=1 Tax=Treponema sp. HNW TaxID=3116654 RepID=UPI003D0B3EFD
MTGAASTLRTWKKKPLIKNPFLRWGLFIAVIAYLIISGSAIKVDPNRIAMGASRIGKLFSGFFHPDFVSRYKYIVQGTLESLAMTLAASLTSMFLAIPFALCASRNLVPKWVYAVFRLILMLIRSLHVVVMSILFVVMFGYGPLAGVATLMLNSIGFIGKLLAEDIENINEEQLEAVRATGANWFQTVIYGVWPQISTRFIGLSIYRADISFRQSTIIGIVGAGGIGAVLDTAMGKYDYNTAGAILLVIIVLVLITEYISSSIRRRIA